MARKERARDGTKYRQVINISLTSINYYARTRRFMFASYKFKERATPFKARFTLIRTGGSRRQVKKRRSQYDQWNRNEHIRTKRPVRVCHVCLYCRSTSNTRLLCCTCKPALDDGTRKARGRRSKDDSARRLRRNGPAASSSSAGNVSTESNGSLDL